MKKSGVSRKIVSFVVLVALIVSITGCKSQAVKDCEMLIDSIDSTVTIESYSQIQDARNCYEMLSDSEKQKVENYQVLISKEDAYDDVISELVYEIKHNAISCMEMIACEAPSLAKKCAENVIDLLDGLPSYVLSDPAFSDINDIEDWRMLYRLLDGDEEVADSYVAYGRIRNVINTVLDY